MNKEEIESFKELNIDLQDIDDLDMGLEVISYNVRKTMQEFANIILKQQSQLDQANKKLDKIKEYITSYESISIIQGLDNIENNKSLDKNTMIEMTNRYLEVHDKILSIIDMNNKENLVSSEESDK